MKREGGEGGNLSGDLELSGHCSILFFYVYHYCKMSTVGMKVTLVITKDLIFIASVLVRTVPLPVVCRFLPSKSQNVTCAFYI